jgi:predicted DNA-binding transcriptional regulator YafY
MPKIKDAENRLHILDQILSRQTVGSRKELLKLVNNRLDREFQISVYTLDKDLDALRAEIEPNGVTIPKNEKKYYYSQEGYSHYNQHLNDDDKVMLLVAQNMFQVFKNSRLKEKFRELIMKVIEKKGAKKMWEEIGHLNFIQLEGRLDVPGTALLPDLIQAIFDKTRISFKYKKDGKKRIVSPYFLQQNAQHWYLIAYDHDKKGEEAIRVYALNKICDINPSPGEYYKDPSFRPDEYFRHSLGIWHQHHEQPVKVELEILDDSWYERLQQSKLHPTQKDLGNQRIQIEVYETPELYRLILGFGSDVKVAKPMKIKKAMVEEVKKLERLYTVK